MNIIDKIKQRFEKQSDKEKDDDVLLIELSNFVDELFDCLGDEKTKPEMYHQIIKNYDEAIKLLQRFLEHQEKVTQAWMNCLIAVKNSASFHEKVCKQAKEVLLNSDCHSQE